MYASENFPTKKALIEAVKMGRAIGIFSPGGFLCPDNGSVSLEGPYYPKPHKWYARVVVIDGTIVSVK